MKTHKIESFWKAKGGKIERFYEIREGVKKMKIKFIPENNEEKTIK